MSLFEGVGEQSRHRLDSLAVDTPLPQSSSTSSISRLAASGHERFVISGIKSSWKLQTGCDIVVVVEPTISQSDFITEFQGQPIHYVRGKRFACVKFHSLVAAVQSPVLLDIIEASKRPGDGNSTKRRKTDEFHNGKLPHGISFKLPDGISEIGSTPIDRVIYLDKACVEGSAFCRLVQFMYLGVLSLSESSISETLRGAHFLKIQTALDLCGEYLLNKLQPCNALSIYSLGNLFECGQVEEAADEFLNYHFMEVTSEGEWLELANESVQRLVQRDEIRCHSEADVVRALFTWVNRKPSVSLMRRQSETNLAEEPGITRTESFANMLQSNCIRFAHLSDDELSVLSQIAIEGNSNLNAVWEKAVELERAKRRKGSTNDDDDEVTPPLRKYKLARGTRVVVSDAKATLYGHDGYVYAVTENPDGLLISGSRDQTVAVWEYKNKTVPTRKFVLEGHQERVFGLVSLSNHKLASCSFDQTIRIWAGPDLQFERVLTGHEGWVTSVCEVAGKLVSGSADHTLKVWDTDTGVCEYTLRGHTDHVYGCCVFKVNDSTQLLVSGSQDKQLKIWNPSKKWKEDQTLGGHKDAIRSVKQCGRFLASASADRSIRLWYNEGLMMHLRGSLLGHSDVVETLTSINRGEGVPPFLASGGRDNSINIWDLTSLSCILTLNGHINWVKSLIVLSDGSLASGSADGTIKIWDVNSALGN